MSLVGRLFKRINLPAMIDPKYPVSTGMRAGIANSDILKCYLAQLTLGRNNSKAVGFGAQRFAHQALGLRINGAPIDTFVMDQRDTAKEGMF